MALVAIDRSFARSFAGIRTVNGLPWKRANVISIGDDAPDFTAPVANGDVDSLSLTDVLDDGPVVLAFFPAAFTGTCTTEMCTFTDRLSAFEDVDANVYGVSVDSPFALNEWREQEGIEFGLISDFEKEIIEDYGVRTAFEDLGVYGLSQRAVFVVDADGSITYRWVAEDPGLEPDYEAVERAAVEAGD